jgi:hypothetical protein
MNYVPHINRSIDQRARAPSLCDVQPIRRAAQGFAELAVSRAIFGSDPCIFDGSPPFSPMPGVLLELPIISNFLPCGETLPRLGVLLSPKQLAFPNSLGALSPAHAMALPFLPAQMVSS